MKQVGEVVAMGESGGALGEWQAEPPLPFLIAQETPRTQERYLEFFAVTIRTPHTRRAYTAAARRFFAWAQTRAPRLAGVTHARRRLRRKPPGRGLDRPPAPGSTPPPLRLAADGWRLAA